MIFYTYGLFQDQLSLQRSFGALYFYYQAVMYDLLAVSNGYLHHIRLHETFNLGDLSITSNLIDFLAKMGTLLAVLGLAFSTVLALSSLSSEYNTPNSFKRLVHTSFKEFCWFTVVFVSLFCSWVRFFYQGT